jgi:Mce-associated membrane protein
MSTASVKATAPESAAEPETDDAGHDENIDNGDDRGLAEGTDTGPPDSDDAAATTDTTGGDEGAPCKGWRTRVAQILALGVLPATALLLAGAAGYLKWADGSARDAEMARAQSVQAAIDSTMAMLSYRPDTVESNLAAARDRMTGAFRDSYSSLTHDVVIPGAKQRQISAVATVPAAASVSATPSHAVVLVFVDQTAVVGNDPPTDTASSVKVTLEKVQHRWLISQFEPV